MTSAISVKDRLKRQATGDVDLLARNLPNRLRLICGNPAV